MQLFVLLAVPFVFIARLFLYKAVTAFPLNPTSATKITQNYSNNFLAINLVQLLKEELGSVLNLSSALGFPQGIRKQYNTLLYLDFSACTVPKSLGSGVEIDKILYF
ncbi:MAG: hypothetical protein RMY35_018380 [Nostoc sp. DedSLP01]